ncbi:MAG: 50S ribosomal protein L17 [Candidatus Peribacteraceae bacterium]|nr:50S ribosomal protein L17 [Candidatus Peribacteraceae bacterium]
MRHRLSRLRLRHKPAHSKSLLRNLATSVLLYESVRTTKKRAEVVQPIIEKIITTAKTKDARNAIRAINTVVTHVNASKKVMELLKVRYAKRSSGYTRMVPLGLRQGDGAKMVELSLVDSDVATPSSEENPTMPKKPKMPKTLSKKAS